MNNLCSLVIFCVWPKLYRLSLDHVELSAIIDATTWLCYSNLIFSFHQEVIVEGKGDEIRPSHMDSRWTVDEINDISETELTCLQGGIIRGTG